MKSNQTGEYLTKGDYHINLDSSWHYLPVYLAKMEWVSNYLDHFGKTKKILDAGCGEGVLVKKYRDQGFDMIGMDLNYATEYVFQRSILETELEDASLDLIICLDVLEHMPPDLQELALKEFARILKPDGNLLISLPNLAHLASRVSFFFTGNLIRTSEIGRHPGDRPINEFRNLIKRDFKISKRVGLFPTFPLISLLTLWIPSKILWLHKIYNRLLGYPNICFVNIMLASKK